MAAFQDSSSLLQKTEAAVVFSCISSDTLKAMEGHGDVLEVLIFTFWKLSAYLSVYYKDPKPHHTVIQHLKSCM